MKVCTIYDDYSADVDDEKRELADYYIKDYFELVQVQMKEQLITKQDSGHRIDKYLHKLLTNAST